jgi:hypothetical protein
MTEQLINTILISASFEAKEISLVFLKSTGVRMTLDIALEYDEGEPYIETTTYANGA